MIKNIIRFILLDVVLLCGGNPKEVYFGTTLTKEKKKKKELHVRIGGGLKVLKLCYLIKTLGRKERKRMGFLQVFLERTL